jgi:hypothetical protein
MTQLDNPQSAPDAMLEQRIRKRAEEIRQRRERDPQLFDWLLAEAEILAECHTPKGKPEVGAGGIDRPLFKL